MSVSVLFCCCCCFVLRFCFVFYLHNLFVSFDSWMRGFHVCTVYSYYTLKFVPSLKFRLCIYEHNISFESENSQSKCHEHEIFPFVTHMCKLTFYMRNEYYYITFEIALSNCIYRGMSLIKPKPLLASLHDSVVANVK